MWSRVKTLALLGVAAAAFLPLYGDPRPAPVSQAEWARMVLRAIDLLEATERAGEEASRVFQVLSWKGSLLYPAHRYLRSAGIEVIREGEARRVRATAEVGEVAYPVAIVRGGDYRLRLRMAGSPQSPAEAEIAPAGETTPLKTFQVVPASAAGWADAGGLHLDRGAYTVAVLLPRGAVLDYLELAPPCLNPIEPHGGWRATAIASTEDVAVTVLQALDLEHELPPAAASLERAGADFLVEGRPVPARAGGGLEALELKAGSQGLRAVGLVEVPERGVYTLSVFGDRGSGQSWLADACRKAVLCPAPETSIGPSWQPVMTGEFAAGRHSFAVTLTAGAGVGRMRIERKKSSASDYVATLRRLGFDPGPDGYVTRSKAVDAMRFIERRMAIAVSARCGEIVTPGAPTSATTLVAQSQAPGQGGGGAQPPTTVGPAEPPLAPPVLPPQGVVSPVRP